MSTNTPYLTLRGIPCDLHRHRAALARRERLDTIIMRYQRRWRVLDALGRANGHLAARLARLTRAWLDARHLELTA